MSRDHNWHKVIEEFRSMMFVIAISEAFLGSECLHGIYHRSDVLLVWSGRTVLKAKTTAVDHKSKQV